MSVSRKKKQNSKDNIAKAIDEIKSGTCTITDASKKLKIPFTTLRVHVDNKREKFCSKYSEENIQEAVSKIRQKTMTAYAASKIYKIPKTTLWKRSKQLLVKKHGSTKVLSDDIEAQLAEWIVLCAKSGYPKSKRQILNTAAEIAKLNTGKSFIKGKPSYGWFKSFSDRHPEVRKRTPESIGKASAAITSEGLRNFFSVVEDQFKESGHSNLLGKPQHWWNVDETGFEMNPTPRSVYAGKGVKTVHIVEKGKSKEMITCTYAVCGDGSFIPPLVTFKETFANLDVVAYVSKDIGANFGFNNTETGWMKGDAFFFFVTEHLYPRWLDMKAEFPIVLVVDGYSSHKNTKLFIWCKDHDVILLLLYPNSTHIVQVLDVAIFGPLKLKYSEFYEEWKLLHQNDNFSEMDFIKVLKTTNDAVLRPETILNGWRATGLQPFKFENVNLDILLTNESSQVIENQQLNYENFEAIMTIPIDLDDVAEQTEITFSDERELIFPIDLDDEIEYAVGDIITLPEYACNSASVADVDKDVPENILIPNECENSNGSTMTVTTSASIADMDIPENISIAHESENSNDSTASADSTNTRISFSDIHKNIGLFANNFDDYFGEGAFGFDHNDSAERSSIDTSASNKIKKLVEKIRLNIRQLGIYMKVHDRDKLLNILVIAQQLNIICPMPKVVLETAPLTPKDILTVPTIARTKRVRKKLSFGVMSDIEIVNQIEEIIESEVEEQRQTETVQLADIDKTKDIDALGMDIQQIQSTLAEKRTALKQLKETKSAEKKAAVKRKVSAAKEKKKNSNAKQFKPNQNDSSTTATKRSKKQ